MKNLKFVVLFLFLALFTSCVKDKVYTDSDVKNIMMAFENKDFDFTVNKGTNDIYFSVKPYVLDLGNEEIMIYKYNDSSVYNFDLKMIKEDGSLIGYPRLQWKDTPYFYKKDNLIILYVGDNQKIISVLNDLYGQTFVSSRTYD